MLRRRLKEILDRDNIRDLIDVLEGLVEELVSRYRPVRIILAGSLAEGRFVRGLSDIDLLVVVRDLDASMDRFTIYGVG
ncbi:MAG: nucleotidyltransferase domain-containing protein, partial [Sulfolobales archaeon]